ncbi:hypothetical protein C8R43DRAFT_991816, partial [Mycena crocata]
MRPLPFCLAGTLLIIFVYIRQFTACIYQSSLPQIVLQRRKTPLARRLAVQEMRRGAMAQNTLVTSPRLDSGPRVHCTL